MANVDTYTTSSAETFSITLTDVCASATITSYNPGSQSYTIGDSALVFSFTLWTIDSALCPTVSYASVITSPSMSWPSWITYPYSSDYK